MNIYSKNDYRQILKIIINERKSLDSSVNFQQLATHARVPKSYLSRVVHGKADLNTDQLFLVCQFLAFNERESSFMQLLLEYARTGLKIRKEKLLREIRQIQAEHLDTKEHLKAQTAGVSNDDAAAYYLDPIIQIVHICLSIPRYQKDLSSLANNLRISISKLSAAINKLEQMNLIARTKDGVKLLVENIHLPKQSPIYKSWRNQLKLMSIGRIDSIADDQAYSFSVVFSASEDIRKEIQGRFLAYLKGVEELVGSGPQEEAYQMSFELFSWTKG